MGSTTISLVEHKAAKVKDGQTHQAIAEMHLHKAAPHLLRAVEHMREAGTLTPAFERVVGVLTARYQTEHAERGAVVPDTLAS